MIYQEPRETLATALMSLKEAIPELSVAMQDFIRDKRKAELKVRRLNCEDADRPRYGYVHVVSMT